VPFARSEVRQHNGAATLFVEGEPVLGMAAAVGPADDAAAVMQAAACGADILAVTIQAATECWVGDGRYDWAHAEERLAAVEQHGGKTRWLICLPLGLVGSWFARAYPSEVHNASATAASQGNPQSPVHNPHSPAVANIVSPLWCEKACDLVRDFVAWLATTPWAPRIIGFALETGHPVGWQIWDARDTARGTYHEVYTREFRRWLRRNYTSEAGLRAAWGQPDATFDAAACPSGDARRLSHARGPFSLRDPAAERPAIDYYRFLNSTVADHLAALCRAAKQAAGNRIVCGGFHRDPWRQTGVYSTIQEGGGAFVHRLADSQWVDFLAVPADEEGETPPADSLAEGARHIVGGTAIWTVAQSQLAADPEPLRKLAEIGTRALELDRRSASQVALVWSDLTPLFQAAMSDDLLRYELACHQPLLLDAAARAWRRAGVPYDICELADLARPDFPGDQYRLLVFVNCARVPGEAAEGIRRWQRDGRVLCWTYAAAVLDDERLDPALGADLRGIRVGWKRERRQIRVLIHDSGYALTQGGDALNFGTESSVGPVFFADDAEACVFGRLRDGGEPAFALRHHAGWRSIFLALPNFGPQLLRNLAAFAGAHVWCESGDALHASRSLVCLHATSDGDKLIRLPQPAVVTDLSTGQRSSEPTDAIRLAMPAGATRLWLLSE